ncbi:GMC family oxidoreductase [Rhodococcus tibetensis]|uniref:GMC family oxidoreductase n=1 Tax=Rhodococcus tibetensis TaxID=2965064 RepID=A0ABT1QJJ3_9NOCA|nr:GMC family oxidoreductase [Rhodococcus sp. FXJ9.536]MCQ4122327.1 GMC family oxidoreductase [Rhodococcus sp. FXJ9.536]
MNNTVVIVGGGSAGAVLASRLSENPGRQITLVEAGPAYRAAEFPQTVTNAQLLGAFTGADWGYQSAPGALDHPIALYRGKVLGGSSAVNGSVFIRPTTADIDRWRAAGAAAFTQGAFIEAFERIQVPVHTLERDELSKVQRSFTDAADRAGVPESKGFNSANPAGWGAYPMNVVDGVRVNTALAYLTDEVRSRPNLTVRGNTTVDAVVFEEGTTTATGIRLTDGEVIAADEVVLSAGTYGSAAILLRSGIGPARGLADLGIATVVDAPVGKHIQDHPFYYNAYAADAQKIGTQTPVIGAKVWAAGTMAAAGEFDIHITATHLIDQSLSPTGAAFVLAVALTRPASRGTITLASKDANVAPIIDLNLLGEQSDRDRLAEAIQLARRIGRTAPLSDLVVAEMMPGADATDTDITKSALHTLDTYHHPVSSAPIGPQGTEYAVVDTHGGVYGTTRLRVVDASILPDAPSVATNPSVISVAEIVAARVYGA